MNEFTNIVPNENNTNVVNDNINQTQELPTQPVVNNAVLSNVINENDAEKKERKFDENGFVIEDPDDDAIIFDEDPFQFEVEAVQEAPAIEINGESSFNPVSTPAANVNVGTEQSGNITF